MSAIDILRRVTKPTSDAKVVASVRARYGSALRENASNDDQRLVVRARKLVQEANVTRSSKTDGKTKKPAFG